MPFGSEPMLPFRDNGDSTPKHAGMRIVVTPDRNRSDRSGSFQPIQLVEFAVQMRQQRVM